METLVIFTNTQTHEYFSKSLEWLFNKKTVLKYFNGKDASLIGYAYGRITALATINNEKA